MYQILSTLILTLVICTVQAQDLEHLYQQSLDCFKQKDYPCAVQNAEKALLPARQIWRVEDQNYGNLLYLLAQAYEANRQYESADTTYQAVLRIFSKVLGENHPDYKKVYQRYLTLQPQNQDSEKSLEILSEAIKAQRTDSVLLAELYFKRGELYWKLNQQSKAQSDYLWLVAHLSYASKYLIPAYYNLGCLAFAQEKYAEAEDLFLKIEISEVSKNNMIYLLNTLFYLAILQEKQNKPERAHIYFTSLFEHLNINPSSSPDLYTKALYSWANVQVKNGSYTQADSLFQLSLQTQKTINGELNPDYAAILHLWAKSYKAQGNLQQAEILYRKALDIRLKTLGDSHPQCTESWNDLGVLCFQQGKSKEAEELLQKALQSTEKQTDLNPESYLGTLKNLTSVYTHERQYLKAQHLYEQALAFGQEKKIDNEALKNQIQLEITYLKFIQQDFREAKISFEKALASPNLLSQKDKLGIQNKLAQIYMYEKDYFKAEKTYSDLSVYYQNEPLLQSEILLQLAQVYYGQGDLVNTEKTFQEVLSIYDRSPEDQKLSYASSLKNLAAVYKNQNRYQESEQSYIKALELVRAYSGMQKAIDIEISILDDLALLYREQGRWDASRALQIQACDLLAEITGKDHPHYARSLQHLALVYQGTGHFQQADSLFRVSTGIIRKTLGQEHPSYAEALHHWGNLMNFMGLHIEAEKLFMEALKIRQDNLGITHPDYATTLNKLGSVYLSLGKSSEAEELYQKALTIRLKALGEFNTDYAASLDNMAGFYQQKDDFIQAEAYYLKSKEIRQKILGNQHPSVAASLNNLGLLYEKKSDLKAAEQNYHESWVIFQDKLGFTHPNTIMVANNLALLLEKTQQTAQAKNFFREMTKGILYQFEHFFVYLSDQEKREFYVYYKPLLDNFMVFVANYYQKNPLSSDTTLFREALDIRIASKALILNSSSKIKNQIFASQDQELILQFQNWQVLKEKIAKAYSLGIAQAQKKGIALRDLEAQANELEKQISAKSLFFKEASPNIADYRQSIIQNLQADEAAVEVVRLNTDNNSVIYMTWILSKQKTEVLVLNKGLELENRDLKYYKNHIQNLRRDTLSYDKYWAQIQEKLGDAQRIYLSPDGVYNQINLYTLYHPTLQKYLIDTLEIVILTNLKEILSLKQTEKTLQPAPKSATLIGRPMYEIAEKPKGQVFWLANHVSDLPGTETEVAQIASILQKSGCKTDLFLHDQANEMNLKGIRNPEILHIATHGFFLNAELWDEPANTSSYENTQSADVNLEIEIDINIENLQNKETKQKNTTQVNAMLRSGLLLSGVYNFSDIQQEDGILTAFESGNLYLDSTALVVLSACETGLGEIEAGEGVYGLQRGFKLAGAKAILMSLWKVDDTATQELMEAFYRYWLQNISKKEALRRAQNLIKEKYKYPYYWGSFVMNGE